MDKGIYTAEEIATLSRSRYVTKCSEKAVTYSTAFKLHAVKRYSEGLPPSQIFEEAGLGSPLLSKNIADWCLKRWRKVYAAKGEVGLFEEARGKKSGIGKGRPKTKGVSDADKIKRLEIEVAYLKAKNAFLAKLRATLGG